MSHQVRFQENSANNKLSTVVCGGEIITLRDPMYPRRWKVKLFRIKTRKNITRSTHSLKITYHLERWWLEDFWSKRHFFRKGKHEAMMLCFFDSIVGLLYARWHTMKSYTPEVVFPNNHVSIIYLYVYVHIIYAYLCVFCFRFRIQQRFQVHWLFSLVSVLRAIVEMQAIAAPVQPLEWNKWKAIFTREEKKHRKTHVFSL